MQHRTPMAPSTVAAVLLDAVPEWDRLTEVLTTGHEPTGLRHRVIEAPLGLDDRMRGEAGPASDWLLRRTTLPAPASLEHTLEAFRRDPGFLPGPDEAAGACWDLTLVDGLDGGRAALLVRLLRPAGAAPSNPDSMLSWARSTSDQAAEAVRATTHMMTSLTMAVVGAFLGRSDKDTGGSPAPRAPRLHVVDAEMSEFRPTCEKSGYRIESGFAAAVTIACAEYLRRTGRSGRPIRTTIGNLPDRPTELLSDHRTSAAELMHHIDGQFPVGGYDEAAASPVPGQASGPDATDVWFTCLPGSSKPLSVGGATVERYFGFTPIGRAAVSASLMSYRGTGCLGVAVDPTLVPDRDTFDSCLWWGLRAVVGDGS